MEAQITRHLLVPPPFDRQDLARILVHEYATVITSGVFSDRKGGFEVYVRAYPSNEHYYGSMLLSVGTIGQHGLPENEALPDLSINEAFLDALNRPPEVRFGLPESRRREIFSQYLILEGALLNELGSASSDVVRRRLRALKREQSQRLGMSYDDFQSLVDEGVVSFWPFPRED